MVDILAVQERLIKSGYQYTERIFNDGNPANCWISATLSTDPHYLLSVRTTGDVGWGRYSRNTAWSYAEEWLNSVELGLSDPPSPVEY